MNRNIFLFLSAICMSLFSSGNAAEYPGIGISYSASYNRACFSPNWCQIADAGFSTSSPAEWYTVTAFPYPIATPLSLFRNRGTVQGNFLLTPTGLIIGQPGNYSVNFNAILTFTVGGSSNPFVTVFLVKDGVFNPLDTSNIGGVSTVPFEQITTIQATGVLQNVLPGTALSLVISNGGSGDAVDITVVAWGISVFRIPCDPIP